MVVPHLGDFSKYGNFIDIEIEQANYSNLQVAEQCQTYVVFKNVEC